MTTRWARFARGWLAAAVSVFVALCSHSLAGGAVPSAPGVALCLAFAGMLCIALAGKTLSLLRLSISVVVSQFLFHGVFSLLGTASAPGPSGNATMPGMVGDGPLAITPVAGGGMPMPDWMWIAHAIAAVVTIAALRYGERTFWRLLDLARPMFARLLPVVVVALSAPADARPTEQPRPARRAIVALTRMRHRGPPALSAA